MKSSQQSQPGEWVLTLPGNVKISVPGGKHCLSTYVLLEQGDWFEQEISFLRKYLSAGMKIIDVGANYGMYTLSMAQTVGDKGYVWAFEPAADTVGYLNSSIKLNQFDHISLLQQGLSNREGSATFYISGRAEMNSLNPVSGSAATETIQLTTLDQCMDRYHWADIDFIKLDAEGEESRIIDAAGRMLSELSPLIMFELKHSRQVNLPLIERFAEHSYDTYWLMPGLQLLVPFNPDIEFDPYLLNLFCCKRDKAERLAQSNVLVQQYEEVTIEVEGKAEAYLDTLPFSSEAATTVVSENPEKIDYQEMLDYYVASFDPAISPVQRVASLMRSLEISRQITRVANNGKSCSLDQVASHIRIAHDSGARVRGVQLAREFLDSDRMLSGLSITTPFLPACARYDLIAPGANPGNWLLSSIVEQWVKYHSFSSYFTAIKALPELRRLAALGFMDEAMKRRFNLVSSLKFKD